MNILLPKIKYKKPKTLIKQEINKQKLMKQTLIRNDISGRRLKPKTLRANKSGEREAIFLPCKPTKLLSNGS